jgi:hypothetical protein
MDKLPAGEYYIGDPCYVISKWDDYLKEFWATTKYGARGGMFDFDGHTCAAFYTKHGDGQYPFEGAMLPVDSGSIGAVPLVLCDRGCVEMSGAVVHMGEEFRCTEKDGRLHFGDRVVDTNDDEEDDYES